MVDFIVNFGKMDFLIILAMLPSIILGFIIYKKDVVEKEPVSLLIKLFLFGGCWLLALRYLLSFMVSECFRSP